jgi:hypothetical protein
VDVVSYQFAGVADGLLKETFYLFSDGSIEHQFV